MSRSVVFDPDSVVPGARQFDRTAREWKDLALTLRTTALPAMPAADRARVAAELASVANALGPHHALLEDIARDLKLRAEHLRELDSKSYEFHWYDGLGHSLWQPGAWADQMGEFAEGPWDGLKRSVTGIGHLVTEVATHPLQSITKMVFAEEILQAKFGRFLWSLHTGDGRHAAMETLKADVDAVMHWKGWRPESWEHDWGELFFLVATAGAGPEGEMAGVGPRLLDVAEPVAIAARANDVGRLAAAADDSVAAFERASEFERVMRETHAAAADDAAVAAGHAHDAAAYARWGRNVAAVDGVEDEILALSQEWEEIASKSAQSAQRQVERVRRLLRQAIDERRTTEADHASSQLRFRRAAKEFERAKGEHPIASRLSETEIALRAAQSRAVAALALVVSRHRTLLEVEHHLAEAVTDLFPDDNTDSKRHS